MYEFEAQPPPPLIAELTSLHLSEGTPGDAACVRAILSCILTVAAMGRTEADDPAPTEAELIELLLTGAGLAPVNELAPPWVLGVGAGLAGLWDVAMRLTVQQALRGLGRVVEVRAAAGADAPNPGEVFEALMTRMIARRRKLALDMPVDRTRARKDARQRDDLIRICSRLRDSIVAAEAERRRGAAGKD